MGKKNIGFILGRAEWRNGGWGRLVLFYFTPFWAAVFGVGVFKNSSPTLNPHPQILLSNSTMGVLCRRALLGTTTGY